MTVSTAPARPRTFVLDSPSRGAISCTSDLTPEAAAGVLRDNGITQRSDFASDLCSAYASNRISPKQTLWLVLLAQEALDKKAAKDAPAAAAEPGEFAGIVRAIQNLQAGKARKVVLRVPGLKLSGVIDGPNAGCVYVKTEAGSYVGKILPTGAFRPVYGGLPADMQGDILEALRRVNDDPQEAAVAYGRETGQCSCCGRKLTNEASIALGIGPICLEALMG